MIVWTLLLATMDDSTEPSQEKDKKPYITSRYSCSNDIILSIIMEVGNDRRRDLVSAVKSQVLRQVVSVPRKTFKDS